MLMVKADALFRLGQLTALLDTAAGFVGVTEELHVTAQREQTDSPARAVLVVPAEQLFPKPDGKNIHLHTIPPGDDEMSKLVNEDDNGQDNEKRKDRGPEYRKDVHAVSSL